MAVPSIDYLSRDYAGIRDSALSYAGTVAPEWTGAQNGGDPNDLGVVLIESLAYIADVMHYYIDRASREAFLGTATQRASILSAAALLDYTPSSATAATAAVTMQVTSPDSPVTIPRGFQISTAPDASGNSVVFETTVDTDFVASPTPVSAILNVQQGKSVVDEQVGISCGSLGETFSLTQAPVVSDSLVLTVLETPDGVGQVWSPVGNLLEAGPYDSSYAVSLDDRDSLTVTFGDGVHGRVPIRGAVVKASYRVGGGTSGNVVAQSLTNVVDATDVILLVPANASPASVTVTNSAAASGGTDSESLEVIRQNAPKALRARGRAVTTNDYEALALAIPDVQLAKASAVSSVYTSVVLYVAPPGGGQPTQRTLNAVVDYFSTRCLAGVTVVCAGPTYVSVDLQMEISVNSRYSASTVKQAVRNALQQILSFENIDFGGRVSLGAVYSAVAGIEGVDNLIINRLSRDGLATASDVVLRPHELALAGAFTLTSTGGLVNSAADGDTIGSEETAVQPTAAPAPTVALFRCDPNSSHVDLTWTAAVNTTYWDVVVRYLNGASQIVEQLVIGPWNTPQASIDLPLIGAGKATNISFSTRAYNGLVGPAESPLTTTTYGCG